MTFAVCLWAYLLTLWMEHLHKTHDPNASDFWKQIYEERLNDKCSVDIDQYQ